MICLLLLLLCVVVCVCSLFVVECVRCLLLFVRGLLVYGVVWCCL